MCYLLARLVRVHQEHVTGTKTGPDLHENRELSSDPRTPPPYKDIRPLAPPLCSFLLFFANHSRPTELAAATAIGASGA
jgi:hypothetical protein